MSRSIRFTVKRTITVRATVQTRRFVQTRSYLNQGSAISLSNGGGQPTRALGGNRWVTEGYAPIDDPTREFDLFLSHASEDKEFARSLADALVQRGMRVWFDETAIRVGDSLRESIDNGLRRCRFGVVVFSHSFFAKKWTNYELNGLVTREVCGHRVLLPIWHPELSFNDMAGYSPSLADKKALLASSLSVFEIADELVQLVLPAAL